VTEPTDPRLEFQDIALDPIGGHEGGGPGLEIETFGALNVVKEISVAPGKVAARDGPHVGCGTASSEAFGGPAGGGPGEAVGLRPLIKRQGPNLEPGRLQRPDVG
jgi:hypothetical protein